jgi:hypothetical protein
MKISAADKKLLVSAQVVLERLSVQGMETPETMEARKLSMQLSRWISKATVTAPEPSTELPEASP